MQAERQVEALLLKKLIVIPNADDSGFRVHRVNGAFYE